MEEQSKALTVFNFEEQEIRTVVIDGKIWFVAADVCKALDIKNVNHAVNGNPSRNEEGLDEDERGYYNVTTPGGIQQMLCINESGIQELIWKSRKPKAKAFKRWVKRDVIPSIASTGIYDPAGQLVAAQEEIARLHEVIQVHQQIAEQALRVEPVHGLSMEDTWLFSVTMGRVRDLNSDAADALKAGKYHTMLDTMLERNREIEKLTEYSMQADNNNTATNFKFAEQEKALKQFRQQAKNLLPPARKEQPKQIEGPQQGE